MEKDVTGWVRKHNKDNKTIEWKFTRQDADKKTLKLNEEVDDIKSRSTYKPTGQGIVSYQKRDSRSNASIFYGFENHTNKGIVNFNRNGHDIALPP